MARLTATMMALLLTQAAHAGDIVFDLPSDDRWHYPFNFSPGTRELAPVFSSIGDPNFHTFNDRDGILIVAWDTAALISPGQPLATYRLRSLQVTLMNIEGADWIPDLTIDEWYTHDWHNDGTLNADGFPRGHPSDSDGESDDVDPGRPIELFGAGFGPTYSLLSWNELSPYAGGDQYTLRPRDPFPFTYEPQTLAMLHVEDSLKGAHNSAVGVTHFTAIPWAIGVPINYTPGNQPVPFDVVFDVDLAAFNGQVQGYFQNQLAVGRVVVVITCLRETSKQGAGNPNFFTKEILNIDPSVRAPTLRIEFASPPDGDMDDDNNVSYDDFAVFWDCLEGPQQIPAIGATCLDNFDFDTDEDVDLRDLSNWMRRFTGGS